MLCTYPAVIHQDPDGLWLEFIDFHCSTHADNLQELLLFAREAMECHILGLLECGEKLPVPSAFFDKPNTTLVQSDIDLAQNTKGSTDKMKSVRLVQNFCPAKETNPPHSRAMRRIR